MGQVSQSGGGVSMPKDIQNAAAHYLQQPTLDQQGS